MKPRAIQPLLRVVLALLGAYLVASPQPAKAMSIDVMLDHDWTVSVGRNTFGLQGLSIRNGNTWTEICLGDCSLRLEKDFRTVATEVIATLLLAAFGIFALLSFSHRSKPKLTEHVQAP